MTRTIRLRPWQKAALDRLLSSDQQDFLAVATPGAGKTTFALAAARHELGREARRLIVVAPTAHLKLQWTEAAERFGLHLDPDWSPSRSRLAGDCHGIVTSYQQVASSANAMAGLARGAMVILDEIHHAGDDRAWGDAVCEAFTGAARRLSLSGTPFRSDTAAIPFVRYVGEEAVADFEYGYGDALRDGGVVRPVYFPRTNGHMEWMAPDGSIYDATFDDRLDHRLANQRLRTALSPSGDWLASVLHSANTKLGEIRAHHPDAGGLVIALDQDHAQEIARMMRDRLGVQAWVVTSDDPTASGRIEAFRNGSAPWLVAVRMVSEGVDIPRLRVGVYATTTTTELFFRQAVGRLVRWQRGAGRQGAFFFIPDDWRLRAHAYQIADARRHSLRRKSEDGEVVEEGLPTDPALDPMTPLDGGEQLSLFTALSAVVIGEPAATSAPATVADPSELDAEPFEPHDDDSLVVQLPPAPPLAGLAGAVESESGSATDGRTMRAEKRRLRDANADMARALVTRTGWTHARVNGELNRMAGIDSVDAATLEQLRRRLKHAERWYQRR